MVQSVPVPLAEMSFELSCSQSWFLCVHTLMAARFTYAIPTNAATTTKKIVGPSHQRSLTSPQTVHLKGPRRRYNNAPIRQIEMGRHDVKTRCNDGATMTRTSQSLLACSTCPQIMEPHQRARTAQVGMEQIRTLRCRQRTNGPCCSLSIDPHRYHCPQRNPTLLGSRTHP